VDPDEIIKAASVIAKSAGAHAAAIPFNANVNQKLCPAAHPNPKRKD